MSFNSLPFLLFFAVVFTLYWFPLRERTRAQNILLVLASWFFYGYANWKMIPLLLIANGIFYWLGIWIERYSDSAPKGASLLSTLGVIIVPCRISSLLHRNKPYLNMRHEDVVCE